jgi:hypothetical protein
MRCIIYVSKFVHNTALLELSSSETHSETRANYSRHVQLRILDCDSEYSYCLLPQLPILKPIKQNLDHVVHFCGLRTFRLYEGVLISP